ncbi:hypothetical protein RJ639_027753 [Escallonia herrerae]|uniref:EF-hand domain-containing protein n=1 Tax=Escallonia herrerae TaxID=1293975 RepID=A0AA88X4S9_9ASTE|nr:hypothetical protein RJ639_027753 [Escallonia herrerae]
MITRIALTLFLLLLMTPYLGNSRFMGGGINLVSDGLTVAQNSHNLTASTVTCEPTYGFLPCTTEVWGQLFLIVIYEFLLSLGEKYVSEGSELFFKIIGPSIFGGSLFHILGTVPQVIMVLVSGLSASITAAAASEQAAYGLSLLAGSAVMLLTLVWGSCIAFASTNQSEDPNSSDVLHLTPKNLNRFGVTTDIQTSYTARIMMLSMVPFLILQLAKIMNSSLGTQVAVLVALAVTLVLLFAYIFYQVFQPWIAERRFDYLRQKYVKDRLERLLTCNGKPNKPYIKKIFHQIDKNKDSFISKAELRTLVLGMHLKNDGLIREDYVEEVMNAFDVSDDHHIDEAEFVRVLSKWLTEARQSVTNPDLKPKSFFGSRSKATAEEQQSLVVKKNKTESTASNSLWMYLKATFLLVLGTAVLSLLGGPLITSVTAFANATNIPSFFIPYVAIPVALNYRGAIAAVKSVRQKTQQSISLTLSEMYGGLFMNNLVSLTSFLAIVYIRDLSWDVSAEVLVVLIISSVVGLFASFRTSFPLWTAFVAYLLYPVSLLQLYVLTTVFGWS